MIPMMVNGRMVKHMDLESIYGQMEIVMWVILMIVSKMVRVLNILKMETFMLVIIRMANQMDMVNIIGPMEHNLKDIFKMD